jgi:hypothetical protein
VRHYWWQQWHLRYVWVQFGLLHTVVLDVFIVQEPDLQLNHSQNKFPQQLRLKGQLSCGEVKQDGTDIAIF